MTRLARWRKRVRGGRIVISTVDRLIEPGGGADRLLSPGGPIERLLAPGGAVERLLAEDGAVEKVLAEGGVLDQIIAEGGLLDRFISVAQTLEKVAPKLESLHEPIAGIDESAAKLATAVGPLAGMVGMVPVGSRRRAKRESSAD